MDKIRQHEFIWWDKQGGQIVICRHRSEGQDDGSGSSVHLDPAQCSVVVQCKDGAGAADVALLLLMWPLPIR